MLLRRQADCAADKADPTAAVTVVGMLGVGVEGWAEVPRRESGGYQAEGCGFHS